MADTVHRYPRIAARVRDILDQAGVTQLQLASATGLAERTVARRLTGKADWPVDDVDKVALALNVPFEDLVA